MSAAVRIPAARKLPEAVRTLRRLGLRISNDGLLTLSSASSYIPRKVGRSGEPGPLLVPDSRSLARTLTQLAKLGRGSAGPFFAAGKAGQINAALFAAACLAIRNPSIRRSLDRFRARQTSSVPFQP